MTGPDQQQTASEWVKLEIELRNRVKQQEALAQLGERALVERDIDRLLNNAVHTVALTLSVDFVKILELLPADAGFLVRAGFGWNSDMIGSVLVSEPHSYARYALESAVPVVTENFATETRFTLLPHLRRMNASAASMSPSRGVTVAPTVRWVCARERNGLSTPTTPRSWSRWPTFWPAPFSADSSSSVTN